MPSDEQGAGGSPKSSTCRYCGGPMKLAGTQPPEQYINLKVETYECENCGEKSTVVVRLS
jgi:transposase